MMHAFIYVNMYDACMYNVFGYVNMYDTCMYHVFGIFIIGGQFRAQEYITE